MEVEKRKLIKFSNYSYCITLPKWIITRLDWSKGDNLDLVVNEEQGSIVVSKNNKNKASETQKKALTNSSDSISHLRW